MASLWKHPNSSFWVACFSVYSPAGLSRWKRSLKTADRKLARRIADAFEDAGRGGMDEKSILEFCRKIRDTRARRAVSKIFGDIFGEVAGREMGAGTLRAFANSWLQSLNSQIAPQSYLRYRSSVTQFIEFIGAAADRDLMNFGSRDDVLIIQFRDQLAARLSRASVNTTLKIVRQMFRVASERFKIENPAALVKGVKPRREEADRRRAFTLPEIGRILREVRGSEWAGIVLTGLYTGQRLSDIATLRWENVSLDRRELSLTTRKTNRRMLIPLAEPLADYLIGLPSADDSSLFIFPKAAQRLARSSAGQAGSLSNEFYDILTRAGLVARRSHWKAPDGVGRNARRKSSVISFHSFRHTATTLMKNAGIPAATVMDLIGHESKAVSQLYSHTGDAEKRRAVAALPSVKALLRARTATVVSRAQRNKPTK